MEKYTVETFLFELFSSFNINREQVEIVRNEVIETGKCPVRIIVEKKFLPSFSLYMILKQKMSSLSITDISTKFSGAKISIPDTAKIPDFSLVKKELLYNKAVLPLYIDSEKLVVLLADLTSENILDTLVEVYGYPLDKVLCSIEYFDEIFSETFGPLDMQKKKTESKTFSTRGSSQEKTIDIKNALHFIVTEDEFYNFTYNWYYKGWERDRRQDQVDALNMLGLTGENTPPKGVAWFKRNNPMCACFLNTYFPLKGEIILTYWNNPYCFMTNYRLLMRKCEKEGYLLFPFNKIKNYEVVPYLWKYKIIITLKDGEVCEFDLTKSQEEYEYLPSKGVTCWVNLQKWENIDKEYLFLLEMTKKQLQEKLNPSEQKKESQPENKINLENKVNKEKKDTGEKKKWEREIEL